MDVRTFFLIAIGTLGLLSGLLSFIAEGKKLAESDITRIASDECIHVRSPALGLGLAAAIALLVAQIISNSLGGCICCESRLNDPSGKSTPVAVAISCLTLSCGMRFRVTFSIAFLLLVAGASINDKRDASDNNLSTGCYVLKSGVFTGAAFASMTTAILGVAFNLQVFAIRKTIAATMLGAVDGGPTSSAMASNSTAATAVFSSDQRQKARMVLDHKIAYPRSAVNPHREVTNMGMTSPQSERACADEEQISKPMRRTLANTEISRMPPSKQMSKKLVLQQQVHVGSNADKEEDYYGSHKASQSASASYDMHSTDPSGAHFVYVQDASPPLYIRSGGGNA